MLRLNLRYVDTVHFGKSELTNWLEILKKRPALAKLKGDDAAALVSISGDQIVFIHGFTKLEDKLVLRSTRFRLGRGQWNPFMLANYAKSVSIELVGLRTFEQHVDAMLEGAARKLAA